MTKKKLRKFWRRWRRLKETYTKGTDTSIKCPNKVRTLNTTSAAAAAADTKFLQWCPPLCDPKNGSPPGSSVPGILQASILEWVAISSSNACIHTKLLQSCLTLCDPMDSSPPGSSVGFSRQDYWSGLPFPSLNITSGVEKLTIKQTKVSRKRSTHIGSFNLWTK